jgi:DNA-binding SARP family transcriptional activator/TolB-like protein
MFSLHTFGGLKLLDGDGREAAFPEKGLLILVYLMLEPTARASRSMIARLLWGDDNGSAQVNLRKLVSRIRLRQEALGRSFLRFSETAVELDAPPTISDLWFARSHDGGPIFARLKSLVKTLEVEFLQGVDCQSAVFLHWREVQSGRHLSALKEALNAAAGANGMDDIALVREAAFLVFGIDPEDRDIHRILLRIFDAEGEVEHFRQIFKQRAALLTSWSAQQEYASEIRAEDAIFHRERTSGTRTRVKIPLLLLPSTGGQGKDYDTSSLVNDITIGFCALDSLQIADRYTAVRVGRAGERAAATFDQWDRSYILEMRLSFRDNGPLLFSQLVDAASDEIIWAERISLGQSSQAEQSQAVARHIVLSLAGQIERREMMRSQFEENPAAYQRYLAGKRYIERLSVPDLQRARGELQMALRTGSHFAPALSSMARTYSKEWVLTFGADAALLDEAESYAMRAIAARRDIADGYRELGMTKVFRKASDESIEALKLAEALSPGHAGIIADHAEALLHASRPDLALTKIESAIALNPVSPDTYLWTASVASYTLGRFEAALDYIDRMANARLADRISAASWAMLGHQEKAGFFVRRVQRTSPDFDVDRWLSVVPFKEQWQRDIYREGLRRAGFWKATPNVTVA